MIYMLRWKTESCDEGEAGYWDRPLTEEEQHGFFKEHFPDDYDVDGSCYIFWDMIALESAKFPEPLSKKEWTESI
jgi:hypothetical protein